MKPQIWNGCYDVGWKGFITSESFSHPAKYARGLIERIFDHCLERGYLKRGDIVGDCFGGIGTGGIIAAYRGLDWRGVELEKKFVDLAGKNFELHHSKLNAMGLIWPIMTQGDSREFHKIMGGASAVVSSPPYAETAVEKHSSGVDLEKNFRTYKASGGGSSFEAYKATQAKHSQGYGGSRGQIAALKEGTLAGVISSPPYADSVGTPSLGSVNKDAWGKDGRDIAGRRGLDAEYGQSPGQIGALKSGEVSAVVTSPPFEDSQPQQDKQFRAPHDSTGNLRGEYGSTNGQIGNAKGETYWQAMDAVYRSCFQAIKPGGVLVLVVKDYVKGGKRVPLCDDTVRLIEHIGFTMIEHVHAMLTKSTVHGDLFNGSTTSTKSRKSFFRRLAEKKGSPAIDFEEVLFARKPL